jgi:hypothetical protein
MKPTTLSQSDEEVETDFDSDSDYSESEKVLKKNKIQGKYPSLQKHPLYQTHQVSIITSNNLIPNFVGGSLSRCDKGDREYYCITMLTFFKPWRYEKDLLRKRPVLGCSIHRL